jgi:hypothetical protein
LTPRYRQEILDVDGVSAGGVKLSGLTSVIFAAIGVVIGAALTGWFGITQTRQKRVQERRAEVYVDVLAWIWTRMPALQGQLLARSPGPDAENRWPASTPDFPTTKVKTTLPMPEAILSAQKTDPETPFFVALRSRVAVFASHDMARAFDRWVAAYKLILKAADENCQDHSRKAPEVCPDDCVRCAMLALVTESVSGAPRPIRRKLITPRARSTKTAEDAANKINTDLYKHSIRLWGIPGRQEDNLDGQPGCLTKAVAACASEELRRG